jgi:hypothetical protein
VQPILAQSASHPQLPVPHVLQEVQAGEKVVAVNLVEEFSVFISFWDKSNF